MKIIHKRTLSVLFFVTALLGWVLSARAADGLSSAEGLVTDFGPGVGDDPMKAEEVLASKINIEYKDADLSNVLRSLSWTYKLNIVTGPDIKGKVNINLQDISVEQALDAILTINGLVYSKRNGVIYISSGDKDVVEVKTEVISLKYLTAAQGQNLVKKILSSKGDIKIDEVSNKLIITDYDAQIQKVRDLITSVDVAPKQILIESKIIDITSSDLKSLGLQGDVDYQPTKGGLFDRNTKAQEALTGGMDLHSTTTDLDTGQFTLDTLTFKNTSFTGQLDALVRDGKAVLLASPSIAVINGQEARIVIGERFPYKERTQTTSGTTETTKFVDIGTTLKVTPQINDDGYITLYIHPEVSSLFAALDAGPRITTREADTTVRVKQGETLIIGGLIKQTDNSTKERIPIIGKIPIVNLLFSRQQSTQEQTELAVFITPRILFSREELAALGRKKDTYYDSYTLIDRASVLSVADQIFEKTLNLDRGKGVESVGKDAPYRKTQALSQYELIYKAFPESPRAPEAKFNEAMIWWKHYKDAKQAKQALAALISDFPGHELSAKARQVYKEIENQEAAKKQAA